MSDTEAEQREDTRRQLRERGFSETEIARYEAAQAESARGLARHRDAAALLEPVMFACLEKRRFFDALADEPRALVTLWDLCVQSHRNGMSYFVEADPAWLVKDVPRAANLIGETRLAERFTTLLGALKGGRGAGRFSARGVDWSAYEDTEAIVTRGKNSIEDVLDERVLALRSMFEELRARAESFLTAKKESRRRAAEAKQRAARSQWDAMRPQAKPWSVQTRFAAGDALLHASLGLGKVLELVPQNKIKVQFEDGTVRTLVHRA